VNRFHQNGVNSDMEGYTDDTGMTGRREFWESFYLLFTVLNTSGDWFCKVCILLTLVGSLSSCYRACCT
jgi:hypothetical protein